MTEFIAHMRVEELTLPLFEELVELLQWRMRLMRHRIEQSKAASFIEGPAEFVGLPLEQRDRNIRRLLLLARDALENP